MMIYQYTSISSAAYAARVKAPTCVLYQYNTLTSSKFCSLSFIVPPEKRTWMKYPMAPFNSKNEKKKIQK